MLSSGIQAHMQTEHCTKKETSTEVYPTLHIKLNNVSGLNVKKGISTKESIGEFLYNPCPLDVQSREIQDTYDLTELRSCPG